MEAGEFGRPAATGDGAAEERHKALCDEIERLMPSTGWTPADGKAELRRLTGHKSRRNCTEENLVAFVAHMRRVAEGHL